MYDYAIYMMLFAITGKQPPDETKFLPIRQELRLLYTDILRIALQCQFFHRTPSRIKRYVDGLTFQ